MFLKKKKFNPAGHDKIEQLLRCAQILNVV